MQTKDVTEILKTLGWEPYRAEDGSMFAHYHLPDRIVGISYDIVDYGEDGEKFRLSANLTTAAYCLAWEYASGEVSQDKYEDTLFSAKEDLDVTASDLSESHVKESLNRVIAWAQAQDIEQKLREKAANHSAVAEALLGDIDALKSSKFTPQLHVPEFADYATMEWIERLILFAQTYKNGELDDILTRKKPKQRSISLTAASRILKTQGWFSTEPGKMWFSLPDRFIQFDFGFVHLYDQYNVHLEAEISNEEISVACKYIHYRGEYEYISPTDIYKSFNTLGGVSILDKGIDICVETLNEQELTKISERVIQWARAQDLQASIESKTLFQEYSYYPAVIWHLACLALTGKIEVLRSYQNSIVVGKIPEHLQNLDEELEEYVNHAVEFAEKHLKILNEREAAEAHLGPKALITFNKVAEQLKQMGWTVYRDKNYNHNAYFISKDRIINIMYSLQSDEEEPIVAFKASLSTLGFSTAHREIFYNMPQYIALKEAEEVYTVSSIELDEGKLKQICTDMLEWAEQQNVNQIIYDYAALSPDSELDLVARHLIALVLIGDIEKLKYYKENFRKGNPLGFVEEISKYRIDNLLTLARGYRTGFPKNAPILSLDPQITSVASQTAVVEATAEVEETDDKDAPLTMESATALLKSLGWSTEKIDEDDHIASYQLADREVDILYNDEIVKDCPQFDSAFLISTGILSAACKFIDPTHIEDIPDIQLNFEAKGLEIFEPEVTADRLTQALDDALEWAVSAIDLSERLRSDYGIAPWQQDAKSKADDTDYALLHLGALALLGDAETLQSYQQSFAVGDHLGFGKSIQQLHLERAIALAKEVSKVKQVSYTLIEQIAKDFTNH
ncbi:hypothetical protein MNL01_02670 [Bartonella krasnovii]|uniref:Uncharacterized protein n=1 Tax=Bartonella krasnovii TaxID=2267275 RepID=A0A5B9D096_9HYPH|nr:hypothetical protein [Bartonella krasnovii]QEE11937.1 hypothetical protein D1092_02700 [Bartonella krasnovii]UNF42754.1 hypothetical protein MNL08_02665 [Bartonella krasnovii]UNF54624.1 hypothetical protein MNL01_02670 [Bartonella krasnovii]UNF55964.1 hypothetical protein MNL00_02675 [Bartonella krasnovii]